MAGATISLDDAYGASAPVAPLATAGPQPPAPQGEPDFASMGYRPVHDPNGGGVVAWLPPAAAQTAPAAAPSADQPSAAPFTAPLPTPQAEVAPASKVISLDDAYQDAPTGGDQRPVSEALGFAEGVTKPSDNAATWLSKLPGMHIMNLLASSVTGRPTMDQAAAQHAKAFATAEQTQRPGMIGKLGGEVIGTLPTMALPGGPLVQGAAAGAMLTDHPNDPNAVALDAAGGAAGGYLGGKLVGALAKAASPAVRPDVQTLLKYGVQMTPGQIAGGLPQRMEDASTAMFGLGDAIKAAQRKSIETFNRAAWNATLGDIGEKLPDHVDVGRSAAKYVTDRFHQAYEAVKHGLRADVDQLFVQNVTAARQAIAPRALDNLPTFDDILQRSIFKRMNPNGSLDGQAFKDADTELGQAITKYSPSPEPKVQALVDGLEQLRDELRASLNRNSTPEAASRYDAIQAGYAKFARLRAAGGYEGAKDGRFTPAHLARAVRSGDSSVGKGDYARGDALFQDLSDAGKSVLPPTVPDSGTATRALIGELPMLLGFGAESHNFFPHIATAAIASGVPSLAYIGPGRRLAQAALTARPWTPAQSATALSLLRPYFADLGAVGSDNAVKRLPQLPQRQALPAPR